MPPVLGPPLDVAVLVPVFRDTALLNEALQSIVDQTYSRWHCYVIDDASPEDVDAAFAPFAADGRFTLLRHGKNAGLSAARNTGLRSMGEADAVQFLDADDMLTPWALERRVAELRRHWFDPLVAGTYGVVKQCAEDTRLADLESWDTSPRLPVVDWLESDGESPFTVHAPLVRADVARGIGGFNEAHVNGAEDWDYWHRILRHGFMFRPTTSVVGAYRQRSRSMIRDHSSVHLGRADALLDASRRWVSVDRSLAASNGAMPLADAKVGHHRMRRACQWAGMVAANLNDLDGVDYDGLRSFLEPANTPSTRRDEWVNAAHRGMVRGLGIAPADVSDLEPDVRNVLQHSASEIVDRLSAGLPTGPPDPPAEAQSLSASVDADVALIAESVADVPVLLELASDLRASGLDVVAIDIDYIKGSEGAAPALCAGGIDVIPYNRLVLSTSRVSAFVGRAPTSVVTNDIFESASADGAIVACLAEADRELTVEETGQPRGGVRSMTSAELIPALAARSRPAISITSTSFSRLLPAEESAQDALGRDRLMDLRDRHRGETCVIIGNGPSLNDTDLELLRGTATFGVNSIFLADERLVEPLTYYVVEDTAVFKDNGAQIKAYEAGTKLFPTIYRGRFEHSEITENTVFFRMNQGFYGQKHADGTPTRTLAHPRFSVDAADRVFCGQSVTMLNLQFAHWMGFQRVVLIGMDFSYVIPSDAEISGNRILSKSDDPNHFHPDYFGAGKTWKDPKLDRVLISYRLIDDVYRATGREIINST
ncbi:MAG: glycosyltransferase, partial [Actinomycetota bacterium]